MNQNNFEDEDRQMCRSSTGRFWEPISLLKKSHGKKPSHDEIKGITPEEVKKGLNNEKRFRAMFRDLVKRDILPKEYKVQKASRNQDERFKVDSWIIVNYQADLKISIPIQIKSSFFGMMMFIRKFGRKFPNVYIIVMDDKMTPELLVQPIFKIVRREFSRLAIKPTT
jgi:hypothetical protein